MLFRSTVNGTSTTFDAAKTLSAGKHKKPNNRAEMCIRDRVKSYVQDIALAVLDCKETATSRETVIRLMNERGYGVDWQDSHKDVYKRQAWRGAEQSMAVIKAVSSKAGIGHAIDYVTKKEKTCLLYTSRCV